ncbi:hypothetical protein [Georgenia wangjunii]|uniref:hypothetical protein n=1 Tax=Georgenia wangjunii TaxID=3117730 RepID=UPI002F25F049
MGTTTTARRLLPTLAVAAVLLAGCGADEPEPAATTTPSVEEPSATAVPEPTSATPTEMVTEDEVEASGEGSRENPHPAGATFEVGGYELTVGHTNFDATADIRQAEADAYYDGDLSWVSEPAEGTVYITAPVTATYVGEDSGEPYLDLMIAYVTAAGNVYDATSATAPSDLMDANELYAGASFEGHITQEVPAAEVEGGTWRITEAFAMDGAEAFVAAQ